MRKTVYAAVLLVCLSCAGNASSARSGSSLPRSTEPVSTETLQDDVAKLIGRVEKKIQDKNLIGAYTAPQDIVELGKSQDPRAIPVLEVIISSYPSIVAKREAITALQMIAAKDASAERVIERSLGDASLLVRFHAASTLVNLGKTETEIVRVLHSVTKLRNLNDLDAALFEDEWIFAADMPYYLYMKGQKEEAVRINPSAVNINANSLAAWRARFNATREGIIIQSLRKLRVLDTRESKAALKDAARRGATPRIKQEARKLLEERK